MSTRLSGESMWLVIGVVLVVIIMIVVFSLLGGFGPEGMFGILQGIMTTIAMYVISQLHAILR
ncbi:MAG: hypothetical protein V1887_00985 [Candidatus Aenigmatarchaeota archaeon]